MCGWGRALSHARSSRCMSGRLSWYSRTMAGGSCDSSARRLGDSSRCDSAMTGTYTTLSGRSMSGRI